MNVEQLLENSSKLPNVPEVVRELIQQLNNPEARYDEIAIKVSKDQTLSLKILRLVNSAHFGLSRKVSSIDEAVILLGMERLKTLVIASGFASSVSDVEGMDLKEFWKEAFLVATLARWFSNRAEGEHEPDIAFTAGLIHNIGRLLLHLTKPKLAQAIQTRVAAGDVSRSDVERERLTFTTPEAGAALLTLWKLPSNINHAVRWYKQPLESEPFCDNAVFINLACAIKNSRKSQLSLEETIERFPIELAKKVGIDEAIFDQLDEALVIESGLDGLV